MSQTEFPFDLLHTEIINYAKESEERRNAAKRDWEKIGDTCVDSAELDKYNSLIQLAFAHNSYVTQLESMGYRVGYVMVEYVSKEVPKFLTELEVVRFICKEFWSAMFGKQVDNLRTNHRGVYVVQDNKFCTLRSLAEGQQFVRESGALVAFPCGALRGALANLNVQAEVTAAIENLPAVKFNIHIAQKG
uniref:Transport protein particle component, Bet3 n=1 Tax=Angiostrongylus cantonensis TaxID=6313 RepID=A0A0K0D098_ANGCA